MKPFRFVGLSSPPTDVQPADVATDHQSARVFRAGWRALQERILCPNGA